jgi:pimeloyl-ACP methyl ester carboxylesterase
VKKQILILFVLFSTLFSGKSIASEKTLIYLIPGQGSDSRIFGNFAVGEEFELVNIEYFTPAKGTSMKEFAIELSKQIDTTRKFIIIGVSLGGMLATEMTDFLNPEKTIIISSAKCRLELPGRYKIQKCLPVYKLFSPKAIKQGSFVMQPLVEPDRSVCEETFEAMLESKDPLFLKRTIEMIMKWDRKSYSKKIVHIHGNNDNTIPIRNVKCDYLIEHGSHMMMLTRSEEINLIIGRELAM